MFKFKSLTIILQYLEKFFWNRSLNRELLVLNFYKSNLTKAYSLVKNAKIRQKANLKENT